MFGFAKKQPAEAEINPAPLAPKAEPWGEIYTMPQPLGGNVATPGPVPQPGGGKPKRWWVWLMVGVLVAVGAGGTYLAFFRSAPPSVPEPSPLATPVVSPTTNQPAAPAPATPSTTPAERDRIRYGDVSTLQSMLKLYAADNGGRYPVSPLPLVLGGESSKTFSSAGFASAAQGTTYLAQVPANPTPGGADYLYLSSDGSSYTLSFRLEEGAAGLMPGDHQATPQGVDATASTPTPSTSPGTPRQVTPPSPTVDADQDGLTDAEEHLFGTDPAKLDTDGDTYADGAEVAAGFDPAVGGGAKLEASSYLATYQSDRFGYSLKYPKAWLARATDKEGTEVVFTGTDASEFVEVLVVDNPEKLSASAWYAKQVSGLTAAEVPTVTVGSTTWAMSLDGLNAYLATDHYLITLSYNIGTNTQASYYHLFRAMLQLFTLTSPAAPVNTNTSQPTPSPTR